MDLSQIAGVMVFRDRTTMAGVRSGTYSAASLRAASPRGFELDPRRIESGGRRLVLDNTQALSILRGCLAATRSESRATEKAMTSGSMKMTCRYLLK